MEKSPTSPITTRTLGAGAVSGGRRRSVRGRRSIESTGNIENIAERSDVTETIRMGSRSGELGTGDSVTPHAGPGRQL